MKKTLKVDTDTLKTLEVIAEKCRRAEEIARAVPMYLLDARWEVQEAKVDNALHLIERARQAVKRILAELDDLP